MSKRKPIEHAFAIMCALLVWCFLATLDGPVSIIAGLVAYAAVIEGRHEDVEKKLYAQAARENRENRLKA